MGGKGDKRPAFVPKWMRRQGKAGGVFESRTTKAIIRGEKERENTGHNRTSNWAV